MKTEVVSVKDIEHSWFVIDAAGQILGRLSSRIASLLMGKGKPGYSPNQDHGDHVIVVNCEKVRLTGKKAMMKTYFSHSTQPGKEKFRSYSHQMQKDATKIITIAVHGMVPKTNLGRQIMTKLHVYKGNSHPHAAQKPQELRLAAK